MLPINDCAAVAPSSISTSGFTELSSAISQGRHATTSVRLGVLWMRRLPRSGSVNLKCLTALVTYSRFRSTPAAVKGLVEQPARGPDERRTGLVLLIAGLLSDQHDVGGGRPGAEYRLGGVQVQVTALAAVGGLRSSSRSWLSGTNSAAVCAAMASGYPATGSATHANIGWCRCDDAPWYRYTFSDSDFAVEAPHPELSNFDPRHGV